ncbi:MAG TPA: 2-oxo-4-hydroxy-4-carboxy-5-ureidoimidazoline decarboxylase [Bryobacteraceae bacterium]|nr:2-oxo-4-hydroxy-4-carboxy-5-ureidoimidazoline decarboxylase [Bryobacteraceae bacterium]
MTIDEINALSQTEFVEKLGWVFEHSPWVAERAWQARPFASVDALLAAMREEVEHATHDEQLALLCAHPDLGTRARLSAASRIEQSGAGFDSLHEVELDVLEALNAAYRERFGFPFIYAVKGSTQHDILLSLQIRGNNTQEEEFHEALYQVYRIAYFRIGQVVDPPSRS